MAIPPNSRGTIGQLLNLSTRMRVLTGNDVLIGGFIIGGTGNKNVLLRARANFGAVWYHRPVAGSDYRVTRWKRQSPFI